MTEQDLINEINRASTRRPESAVEILSDSLCEFLKEQGMQLAAIRLQQVCEHIAEEIAF